MKTKPLYILISDGGDGSYYPQYTFNTDLILEMEKAADEGVLNYENGIGCDGDGFHYETLQVPLSCTAESLGISSRLIEDDYIKQLREDN